jgi:hypothetical protein
LTKYPVSFDGTILCVEIPKLAFSVSVTTFGNGANPKLSLRFPTFRGGNYQVLFRSNPIDPGRVVPFATTEAGAASTTVLKGTGSQATVYVEPNSSLGLL